MAIDTVRDGIASPILLDFTLNDIPTQFKLDTGAGVSIINKATYEKVLRGNQLPPLGPAKVKLKTYSGETISVLGMTSAVARYKSKLQPVNIHVVAGDGPNLLGSDLIKAFQVLLPTPSVHKVQTSDMIKELVDKHGDLFKGNLGKFKGPPVTLYINEQVPPKFFKPCTVPFALKEKVEKELDQLQSLDIIEPVKYSKWAAPIVAIPKKDGTVRICGDYKITTNKALLPDAYPIPVVEELFAALSSGKIFSKLDMFNAYLQIPIDEKSQELTVINTHKGLFKYKHLPFGISTAPSIFQRVVDTVLQGQKGDMVSLMTS